MLTVDHGLRPVAAAEAKAVAAAAKAIGLPCHILTRVPPAGKTAIQEDARTDRYRMLCEAARQHGADAIATGHTADDQAETLLMRLARGSGVDGLAAMSPISRIEDIALLRPLLACSKRELQAVLEDLGVVWTEDPSNFDPTYERPRLRTPGLTLVAAGLTRDPLVLSARRLSRARVALETARDEANCAYTTLEPDASVSISRAGFDSLPEEIRIRLLGYWLGLMGTPGASMRLSQLERLVEALGPDEVVTMTLAGCHIQARPDLIAIRREVGRLGLPELLLEPGDNKIWDRRFRVALPRSAKSGVVIRSARPNTLPPAVDELRKSQKNRATDLAIAPAAFRGGEVIACPALGIMTEPMTFELALPHPKAGLVDRNWPLADD